MSLSNGQVIRFRIGLFLPAMARTFRTLFEHPDPVDLYNAAFMIRGSPAQAIQSCPWDCADGNGVVDTIDFLALLNQWGQVATACDLGLGDPGVGVEEFLAQLTGWGPCP